MGWFLLICFCVFRLFEEAIWWALWTVICAVASWAGGQCVSIVIQCYCLTAFCAGICAYAGFFSCCGHD